MRAPRTAGSAGVTVREPAPPPPIVAPRSVPAGVGELTFAYTRACRRDAATPLILGLVMLKNGVKYILRGTMRDEQGRGGEHRVDPSFEGAPAFLEHAKETWAKVS
jgi:hypothetical protein